jgi:nucleoside-diphosphate-sugar epimerase
MLTNGLESREFLYASDCSEGLYTIMKRFKFFSKSNKELHLTTGKRIKIISIAKIIQKIFFKRKIKIKIIPSLKIDNLQKNKNNKPNGFILKILETKNKIENGIEKILDFYLMKKN